MKLITSLSEGAVQISWMTAFAMTSDVKMMLETLRYGNRKGIQLLVGGYLSITRTEALELLFTLYVNSVLLKLLSNHIGF